MCYDDRLIEYIKANFENSKKEFDLINDKIISSDLNEKGTYSKMLAIPRVFLSEDIKIFEDFVKTCFSIFNKIIDRYINDPEYRELFPFSDKLKELILLPKQYDVHIPMARIDFFFDEITKSIKLCEINTDGTSGMNKTRIFNGLLTYSSALRHVLGENYKTFELFDSWIEAFKLLWSQYSGGKSSPTVAIVDFLENVRLNEFKHFKETFEKHGINCLICDIRDLSYNGKSLSYQGTQIDIIYRRAVTSDILANFEIVKPFIDAVMDNNVCIVGSFITQIIHNKASFIVLHDNKTLAFMDEDERAFIKSHVPVTKMLSCLSVQEEDIFAGKDYWIIKPIDSYDSKGVYAGLDYDNDRWKALIEQALETGDYLLQEFAVPYRSKNIDFSEENPQVREFSNVTGAYCYNEKMYGIFSRLSHSNVIVPGVNQRDTVTIVV